MKTIPNGDVNAMRDLLTQGKPANDYYEFEQALHDEISTTQVQNAARKGNHLHQCS